MALNAPKLSGQGAWYLERQLHLFKQGARGTHERDVYGKVMAPMAATLVDAAAVADVVAYIASLPDTPAATTIQGDLEVGRRATPPVPPATAPTAAASRRPTRRGCRG